MGALKSKVLVPQASTAGMFVILVPWLYAPVLWCLFNFAFQYGGNWYLLPGFIILAFTPMVYFFVGAYYQVPRPMSRRRVLGLFRNSVLIVSVFLFFGYSFVIGGLIFAYHGNGKGSLTYTREILDELYDGSEVRVMRYTARYETIWSI